MSSLDQQAPASAPHAAISPAGQLAPEPCDVLVIGGGPAGSTAAALLAERGLEVVLLEQGRHPRFHIGESLLPRNLDLLERLGVLDEVADMGVHKPGAEFVSDDTGQSVRFPFALQKEARFTYAYQVKRSAFDATLFANAGRKGARTYEQSRVTAVELGSDKLVCARCGDDTRRFAPRYILDASGRETFLARKLGLKAANKRHNTAAIYAHYENVEPRTGDSEGYITVHLTDDGWFWTIPLRDGITSIGFVGMPEIFKERSSNDMEALLAERIASSPTLNVRMASARRVTPVTSTANYSYCAASAGGDGYFLIGDAFAFVDPVFSSGVLLAMSAGESGATVAAVWLEDAAAGRALARAVEHDQRRRMAQINWLIYRINSPVMRALFMEPRNTLRMRDGLVSMLAGNFRLKWSEHVPVIAFKTVYYTMMALERLSPRRRRRTLEPSARTCPKVGTTVASAR